MTEVYSIVIAQKNILNILALTQWRAFIFQGLRLYEVKIHLLRAIKPGFDQFQKEMLNNNFGCICLTLFQNQLPYFSSTILHHAFNCELILKKNVNKI